MDNAASIDLPSIVGGGYGTMWRSRARYIAIKGSRRSKKSKTQALKLIYQIIKYPLSNALVVRRYYNTLHDSCFTELKWAIHRFGLDDCFSIKESPMEIRYNYTGQKIYFRGMDDPLKITSIACEVGTLCWLWCEEAYEIENEADFDKLVESMMGELPNGYYRQITLTFNPWSPSTWIKARFFDRDDPDVLAITTTYQCNEWLSDDDKAEFERMRREQPDRYWVSGLGNWGIDGAAFFEQFSESIHVVTPFAIPDHWEITRAIDYGLDALACLYVAVDPHDVAYVVGEVYKHGLIVSDAAQAIVDGAPRQQDYITYAPPDMWSRTKDTGRTMAEIYMDNGVYLTKASNDRIQGWAQVHERLKPLPDPSGDGKTAKLQIFSTCKNLIRCLSTIKADEKNCNDAAKEPHEVTHLPDALRYWCVSRATIPRPADTRTPEDKMIDEYKKRVFGQMQRGRVRR